MIGASEQGQSLNISRTPQETFAYCLGVLDAYLEEYKDEEFQKDEPQMLADLLDTNPPNEFGRFDKFSDYLRYWNRVRALMVRGGFYSIPSDAAHL